MSLHDILWRNEGQVLTPELIVGLLHGDYLNTAEAVAAEVIPGDVVPPDNLRPSNKRLVLDQHDRVADWVADQLGIKAAWYGHNALGLEDEDGRLIAGAVIENFNGANANVHIAGVGKYWLNRNMLITFFHYCFNHLNVKRLTGLVSMNNGDAIRFNEHLGFTREFIIKDGEKYGDVAMMCMRKEDCKYLPKELNHG